MTVGRAKYDDGLYEISSQIILKTDGPEALRGALPSYGEEFKNDVFEMHPEHWDGDCTCGWEEQAKNFQETHPPSETCPLVRPNFHHYKSGLKVWWYKYMGRSEESNMELGFREWSTIVLECLDSIKGEGDNGHE